MGIKPDYRRETVDKLFVAWYAESWYYGHHYRFYSYSPWHTCGNGTRYDSEAAAKAAVDEFMDVWIAAALRGKGRMYCPFCSKLAHVHQCVECWDCGQKGCVDCVQNVHTEDCGEVYYACRLCQQAWYEAEMAARGSEGR